MIAGWVHMFGGRTWCAEVVPTSADTGRCARAAARLGRYAAQLSEHGVDAAWKVLTGGDPMAKLEDFAATLDDAVLVASSARWTDWETHSHSATRSLVQTTARPVLVVPARPVANLTSETDPTSTLAAAR